MDNRVFLERYRLSVGRNGQPVELHRSPAARTYRAQEIETGREVALTIVSPAPTDAVTLERLEMEAKDAEKINQINLPRLRDFGRENDELIYVDEYCEGHTAAAWVQARGVLPVAAVLRVALQVVDAMNATAFHRLYHRALNPDNIILVAGQTVEGDWPPVKVLHWFAPAVDLNGVGDARVESAVRFASPEQITAAQVDVRSEIYSLGATMWFLLTGGPPIAAEDASRAAKEKLRGVPKIVRHLLDRMLRTDPADRPHDPVALATYLQTCLARVERRAKIEQRFGLPVVAKARVVEPRTRMPIPIKPLAWAAGILALVALGMLFLPWPLTNKRSAAIAENTTRLPESLPNEAPVVMKDSLGRMDENAPSVTPALVAQEGNEVPRDELAAPAANSSIVPAADKLPEGSDEAAPRVTSDQPGNRTAESSAVASNQALPEAISTPLPVTSEPIEETPKITSADGPANAARPAADVPAAPLDAPAASTEMASSSDASSQEPESPEEGPSDAAPVVAANTLESAPPQSSLPAEPDVEDSVAPPPITAAPNEMQTAASSAPPAEVLPGVDEKPKPVARTSHSVKSNKPVVASHSAAKKKSVAERPATRSKTRRSTRIAKRARPLPKLRVGSAPAELVGTTSDGRWILSVEESGRRVIVPPPPGFGQ